MYSLDYLFILSNLSQSKVTEVGSFRCLIFTTGFFQAPFGETFCLRLHFLSQIGLFLCVFLAVLVPLTCNGFSSGLLIELAYIPVGT